MNNQHQHNTAVDHNRLVIAVVGAGLMGRLTALELQRAGHQVTLIDKDSREGKQSSAYAAAGLLTPLGEAFGSEPSIVEMGMKSMSLWPQILATLDEHVFFQQHGTLMVSHEQDIGDFHRHQRFLLQHYGTYDIQRIDRKELSRLEPELGRSFHQGLFLPEEGQIGNRRLLIALKKQLISEKVDWIEESEVIKFSPNVSVNHLNKTVIEYQNRSNGNHKAIEKLAVDLAIDSRGIGACSSNSSKTSHNDGAMLSDLRAVRGELFQLYAPNVNITRPIRLMHPRYQLYIAPKMHGYFVVGATEIESDDMSPMSVRSAMELLSAAYSVHPGFAEANIRQHVSHCRPAFSDNLPKIVDKPGLLQVNGLYRHGFLIAPVMLERIKAKVADITSAKHNSKSPNHECIH